MIKRKRGSAPDDEEKPFSYLGFELPEAIGRFHQQKNGVRASFHPIVHQVRVAHGTSSSVRVGHCGVYRIYDDDRNSNNNKNNTMPLFFRLSLESKHVLKHQTDALSTNQGAVPGHGTPTAPWHGGVLNLHNAS